MNPEDIVDKYFPIHEYGFVALKDWMGKDQTVTRAGRVSYLDAKKRSDDDSLINTFFREGHTGPREHPHLHFHIGAPMWLCEQILRHRTFNFSKISGRYSVIPNIYYFPSKEYMGLQSKSNKQGRSKETVCEGDYNYIAEISSHAIASAEHAYKTMLSCGVAKELARNVLPASIYSYMYFTADVHNLLHFLRLRLDTHAQKEIQDYACVIAGIVKVVFPKCWKAFEKYQLYSTTFNEVEMQIFRDISFLSGAEAANQILELGMSKKEIQEFENKLKPKQRINVDLDVNLAKDGEFYEQLARERTIQT